MFTKEDCVLIGQRIKQARLGREMTLNEVAMEAGVAASTVQRYEAGAFTRIKLPTIKALARALRVDPAWIALESDDMVSEEDISLDHIPSSALNHLMEIYGDDAEAIQDAWDSALQNPEEQKQPAAEPSDGLSDTAKELLALIQNCPEEKAKRLLAAMKIILEGDN